ncbi:MAG: MotA/TolQ/ExbB proton channel family protein [Roseateles sp.]
MNKRSFSQLGAAVLLLTLSATALAQPEPVSNPYGIDALWAQGDLVARGTLALLVLFSLGSWYVLATKLTQSIRLSREARLARDTVLHADTVAAGARALKAGSTYRYVTETGLAADQQYTGAVTEHIDRNEWINASLQQAVDDVQARQQEGLALLATVGATSPFVGLFGTVWGIYHALTAIGIAGQASIDKVAGPVGEALIMTAIGLAVAVPAVLGYNWLVRRNKVALDGVRRFGTELHRALLGAKLAPQSSSHNNDQPGHTAPEKRPARPHPAPSSGADAGPAGAAGALG